MMTETPSGARAILTELALDPRPLTVETHRTARVDTNGNPRAFVLVRRIVETEAGTRSAEPIAATEYDYEGEVQAAGRALLERAGYASPWETLDMDTHRVLVQALARLPEHEYASVADWRRRRDHVLESWGGPADRD